MPSSEGPNINNILIHQAKMQVKNTEHTERWIKINVRDKKHSSEIAVKIARCSTFQLHKHTQHIHLIHKK